MGLSWQNLKALSSCPTVDGEIVRCGEKLTPELNVIPSATISGDEYAFWKRKKGIDTPIFVKACEGACAEVPEYEKVSHRTAQIRRRMCIPCDSEKLTTASARSANGIPIDPIAEVEAEEMLNIRRRLVGGLYKAESAASYPTLGDFASFRVNALDGEWNGEDHLAADPNAPTPAELTALGTLTTGYLVFASTMGLHWKWGFDRQIVMGDWITTEDKDEAKSLATGKECKVPVKARYVDGDPGLVNKCAWDVVEIVNIPCKMLLDGFYLDQLVRNISANLYINASVRPNLLLVDARVVTAWVNARTKQGAATGANILSGANISGVPDGMSFSAINTGNESIAVVGSTCIPAQAGFIGGNVDPKDSPVLP